MRWFFKSVNAQGNCFKCCYGCTNRKTGCHSKCIEYAEARDKMRSLNKSAFLDGMRIKGGINSRKQTGDYSF